MSSIQGTGLLGHGGLFFPSQLCMQTSPYRLTVKSSSRNSPKSQHHLYPGHFTECMFPKRGWGLLHYQLACMCHLTSHPHLPGILYLQFRHHISCAGVCLGNVMPHCHALFLYPIGPPFTHTKLSRHLLSPVVILLQFQVRPHIRHVPHLLKLLP